MNLGNSVVDEARVNKQPYHVAFLATVSILAFILSDGQTLDKFKQGIFYFPDIPRNSHLPPLLSTSDPSRHLKYSEQIQLVQSFQFLSLV